MVMQRLEKKYQTLDDLINLLNNKGIQLHKEEKIQFRNIGYFHGYKGYRYYKDPNNPIPYTSFYQLKATIDYDSALKNLLYGKVMFIETALKNIALECIISHIKSNSVQDMLDKAVYNYYNCPSSFTDKQRKKKPTKSIKLRDTYNFLLKQSLQIQQPQDHPLLQPYQSTKCPHMGSL